MAEPPANAAVHTPIARPRDFASGNMLAISDRLDGISVAPPIPISARAAIRTPAVGANAAMTEAMPNIAAPKSRMRRRPTRSPTLPIVMSNPAMRKP